MAPTVLVITPIWLNENEIESRVEYAKACVEDCFERGEAPICPALLYTRHSNVRCSNYEGQVVPGLDIQTWDGLFNTIKPWVTRVDKIAVYDEVDFGVDHFIRLFCEKLGDSNADTRETRRLKKEPRTPTRFIAVSGKMGSGKTTLVNKILKQHSDKRIACVSNAWPLKKVAHELCGMSLEEEKKDRSLLIGLGNVVREREVDRLVKMAVKKAAYLAQYNDIVIIDDLRFKNEALMLEKHKFKMIRCEVSDEIRKARIEFKYPEMKEIHFKNFNNTSETQLDGYEGWDMVIDTRTPVSKLVIDEILTPK